MTQINWSIQGRSLQSDISIVVGVVKFDHLVKGRLAKIRVRQNYLLLSCIICSEIWERCASVNKWNAGIWNIGVNFGKSCKQ